MGLALLFDVIVFLRLIDVLQSLLRQRGLLRRACVSPEGLLSCMRAETFCRHFLPSQDGTRLQTITEKLISRL